MYVIRIINGRRSQFLKELKYSYVPSDNLEEASVYPSVRDGLAALVQYVGLENPTAVAVEKVRFKK